MTVRPRCSRLSRRRDDEGFTLIEMMVALILITLVMTSFVTVVIAGGASSRAADVRAKALELGNAEIEQLKVTPWASLGLYTGDTTAAGATATATCAGSEALTSLGASAPTPRVAPALERVVAFNGRNYTVTDCVTWRDDPSDGLNASGTETDSGGGLDAKHVVVTVSWTLLRKTSSLTFDMLRSPTSTEVPPVTHTGATLNLNAAAPSPATQVLAANYALSYAMTLSVTASLPASAVTVSYTGRAGDVTKSLTTTDGGNSWSVTIPAASDTFNPGDTTFTFRGTSASGSAQTTASAHFDAPPTPFTVQASTAPASVGLTSAGYLSSSITLTAVTSVTASSVSVSIPVTAGTITRNLTSSDGKNWSYVLAADTSSGPYTATNNELMTFTATAASGSTTGTASVTLTAYQPPAVSIASISVTENSGRFCINNGSGARTLQALQHVVVVVDNTTTNDTVSLSWSNPTTTLASPTITKVASSTISGRVTFTINVPQSSQFTAGTTTLTVGAARAADNLSATKTQTVTVYGVGNAGNC